MSVISLILTLAVLGLVVWLVTTYIPMDGRIKNIIVIVGVIIALLVVLNAFGIVGRMGGMQVPTVR